MSKLKYKLPVQAQSNQHGHVPHLMRPDNPGNNDQPVLRQNHSTKRVGNTSPEQGSDETKMISPPKQEAGDQPGPAEQQEYGDPHSGGKAFCENRPQRDPCRGDGPDHEKRYPAFDASVEDRMDGSHGSGNQCKDSRDVQLPHDVTPGARTQQMIHSTHRKQEYGRECHDAKACDADPVAAPPAYEVETEDGKEDHSQEMREAIDRLPKAWNGNDTEVIRGQRQVVADAGPPTDIPPHGVNFS